MKFFSCSLLISSLVSFNIMAMDLPVLSESMDKKAWKNFAKIGCGYYPIPEELQKYLAPTVDLANALSASYKNESSYSSKVKQQMASSLEKEYWDRYPEETSALAHGMNEIAASVLLNVLQALEVEPELYPEITGRLTNLEGKSYFKIAYYDATKDLPGIPWHKDIRWITVLFNNQEGLQGKVDGKVIDVHPQEGYFVIHLGVFFEAFINDPKKLKAFEHQVKQVHKNRVSFGVFCNGSYPKEGFYQLNGQDVCWKNPEELCHFQSLSSKR